MSQAFWRANPLKFNRVPIFVWNDTGDVVCPEIAVKCSQFAMQQSKMKSIADRYLDAILGGWRHRHNRGLRGGHIDAEIVISSRVEAQKEVVRATH